MFYGLESCLICTLFIFRKKMSAQTYILIGLTYYNFTEQFG